MKWKNIKDHYVKALRTGRNYTHAEALTFLGTDFNFFEGDTSTKMDMSSIAVGITELISAVKEHAVIWDRSCDDYNATSWPDWIAICKEVSGQGDDTSEEELKRLGE